MENPIAITKLNDFIFCPASIYFHNLFGSSERIMYQSSSQLNGTAAHNSIDNGEYTDRKCILQAIDVYCEQFNLYGKIDIFNTKTGVLTERKKNIKAIYDGYVFQIYGQYFALKEMGYTVKKLEIYSMDNNKKYKIALPEDDNIMYNKFIDVIEKIKNFDLLNFEQTNIDKCKFCIYRTLCDRTLYED